MLRLSRKCIIDGRYRCFEYTSKRWIGLPRRPTKGAPLMKHMRRSIKQPGIPELIIDIPPDQHETIHMKLSQINYYDHAINLKNIGYNDDSSVKSNVSKICESFANKPITDEDYDYTIENVKYDIDYRLMTYKWLITEDGQRAIIDLANHYGIFRDLFPPPALPSSQSSIEVIPPKLIYYFNPLVAVNAEFCVEQTDNDNENENEKQANIIGSAVHRGNLILPEKCINAPNVVIDCSAVNGIEVKKVKDEHESIDALSGCVKLINSNDNAFYTLALVNLDSLFGSDSVCCHWLISNIHNQNNSTKFDTAIEYLPVFGLKGLGYHRYVVLVYRHNKRLELPFVNDFDLAKRKFDAFEFVNDHKHCELTPIGLSWFQTTWDYSSQKIFYDYLDMRSPVFDYIFPKDVTLKQKQFPCRQPFNLYLDHFRDRKEIAKDVLLERLSTIHPYKYENIFDKDPYPPGIHPVPDGTPDWMRSTILKRRMKVNQFRGLRPPSAIRPLNNNADLDTPSWPGVPSKVLPLNAPNPYPDGKRRPKPLRETFWVKPFNEHPQYRIHHEDSLEEDDAKNLRKS